ncbi:MAG: ribulose-phosphate 3-epimerase, partial [Leptospiraceae bacterium]|nr:ribulose-phosphate 3-epimerase [Leptospiraceae bacterium]
MKLSASVLAASITSLERVLPELNPTLIDYIHIDVMDGNFVPQISFGESITKEISTLTKIPLDVHLMVQTPEKEVPKYFSLQPEFITFHIETTHFSVRLSDSIRAQGIKVGVALNPSTPLTSIEHLLDYIDLILIMTVDPGFYGQSFVKGGFEKIAKAKELIGNKNILLEVDGGVGVNNIHTLGELGVDICVAG